MLTSLYLLLRTFRIRYPKDPVERTQTAELSPSLPPVFIEVEKRVIAEGINYIGFNAFQPDNPSGILAVIDNFDHQAGLAVVIGNRTPGQLLWGEGFELGENLVVVIPIAQLILPDGTNIEGRGVIPDFTVPLRPEDLLRGIDTQLNAAIGQLSF